MFHRTSLRVTQQRVRRLDRAAVQRMFPPAQVEQWPSDYLPACGVAHFLRPDGVSLADLIDCYKDLKADRRHELQRDFAADYTMWCRGVLRDFVWQLDDRRMRRMRRFTARDRTMHDADVRELFDLRSYDSLSAESTGKARYEFTPYAATQAYAMHPVSRCASPSATLHFTTFPQIRNIMHTEFDSMGPLRALSLLTGDDLIPTAELLQALVFYLRRRVEEIATGEDSFRRTVACGSSGAGGDNGCSASHSFSMKTPVVCFFGNGRLAWLLNNSELLPFPVIPVQPLAYAACREKRQKHLISRDGLIAELARNRVVADSLSTVFPCESISVGDALRKYRPCIALVEPHVDRDWLCDLRGFYSVREVLLLGPVDSPAMGSFAFPFLTFGVTPGPTTYWTYTDSLQRMSAASRIQMPIDPPYVSQGYARDVLDDISPLLLSPNDCHAFGSQYRCLRFVRKVYPIVKCLSKEVNTSQPAAAAVSK